MPLSLRAVLSTFYCIFCPWKGFRTHVSKIVKLFSNSLFLRCHNPKMTFGQTTVVNSDRKCKFQRFCLARSDCNNVGQGLSILLQVTRCIQLRPITFTQRFRTILNVEDERTNFERSKGDLGQFSESCKWSLTRARYWVNTWICVVSNMLVDGS